MTPKQRHNWNTVARFTFFWALFGSIYCIVEYGLLGDTNVYPSTQGYYGGTSQFLYTIIGSALLGFIVANLEVHIFKGLFLKRSFLYKIFFKSAIYSLVVVIILIFVGFVFTSRLMRLPMFHQDVIESIFIFTTSFNFYSILIYISFGFLISLFILEMSKNLGLMVFVNFLTGKYHKPSVEERVFMFMDMKSSTTIAEKLGHLKYYELLNLCYSDMSDSIINTYGEIYQYVGDEIVISWPLKRGLSNNNCVRCFYEIKEAINIKSEEYEQRFDKVPEFKAALHYGKVTTGEVGELKKEIVFSGDVLNTTSRIQMLCNQYQAQLLITDRLIGLLKNTEGFVVTPIGEIGLTGKHETVAISKLEHANLT
jgi:adenylate cyclase